MPIYEYKCNGCSTDEIEKIWEIKTSIDERDEILCPKCDNMLVRIISLSDFIIK